mmetsp:Transcript_15920/g.60661  ORF Transcript_15920/g.60661 Transcript_15920/m.60661 type:complete len:311 (+) Transcript_15920:502-1434(+)
MCMRPLTSMSLVRGFLGLSSGSSGSSKSTCGSAVFCARSASSAAVPFRCSSKTEVVSLMVSRTSSAMASQRMLSFSVYENGFSIMRPISWMPYSAQVTSAMSGTVQKRSSPTKTKGSVKHQMVRKREVCLAYIRGTGVWTRRSAEPTRCDIWCSLLRRLSLSREVNAWPGSSLDVPQLYSGTIARSALSLLIRKRGRFLASRSSCFSCELRLRNGLHGRPVRCSRSTQGKAQRKRLSFVRRAFPRKGAWQDASRTRSRMSSCTPCQILRPSQKRWYAALVRNTRSRPSAPLSKVCGFVLGVPKPIVTSSA